MAGSRVLAAAAATALLALLAVSATVVQPAAAFTPSKTPPGVPGDVKYIQCSVCQLLAKHALAVAKDVKAKKGKMFKEEDLIDAIEKITDPIQPEGNWIAKIDLQEDGDRLVPVEMDEMGECGRECKTVRMAAERVLGDHDTDVAEKIFTGATRSQLTDWLCYKASSACMAKPPPLPANRPKGPEFVPMDEQAASVQNTLASMKAQGLGGEVFSRDEAIKKYMGLADDEDLDDMDPDDMPEDMRGMYDELIKKAKSEPGVKRDAASAPPTKGLEATVSDLLDKAQGFAQAAKAHVQQLARQAAPHVERAVAAVQQGAGELIGKARVWAQGLMAGGGEPAEEL